MPENERQFSMIEEPNESTAQDPKPVKPVSADIPPDTDLKPSNFLEPKNNILENAPHTVEPSTSTINDTLNSKLTRINKFSAPEIQVGFYTKLAARLMESEQKGGRNNGRTSVQIGLSTFDRHLPKLINAATDDNPIADSYLYEIERQIHILEAEIKRLTYDLERQVEQQFRSHDAALNFSQEFGYSYEPHFRQGLTWAMLWLIKEADKYFNLAQMAAKFTVITSQAANSYRQNVKRKILNIMYLSTRYQHSNVTRSDIAFGTAVAREALSKPGGKLILSPEVLILQKRADNAPLIARRPTNNIEDIKDKLMPIYEALMGQEFNQVEPEQTVNKHEFG